MSPVDVRYWHKADIPFCAAHVRFGSKADIRLVSRLTPS